MNDVLRALITNLTNVSGSPAYVESAQRKAIDGLAAYLAVNPPGPKEPIVVVLSEGAVTDVQIPYEGYSVEVRDYDQVDDWRRYADDNGGDGGDDDEPLEDWTEEDENGDRYAALTFRA
jgi:hypothetical protein